MRVRYADMPSGAARAYRGDRPLVVEFQKGDRVPVDFHFDGQYFALTPVPAFDVIATEHCFVRFWRDGIRVSPDAEHFDGKPRQPGQFRLGLSSAAGQGAKLEISVRTPRR